MSSGVEINGENITRNDTKGGKEHGEPCEDKNYSERLRTGKSAVIQIKVRKNAIVFLATKLTEMSTLVLNMAYVST